jgi:CheY-specific phosphatase CheX
MSADYVQPFVQGMKELMSTMLGATVTVSGEPVSELCPELTSIVELGGHAKGQFALSFPRDTARGMIAAMLGAKAEMLDTETVEDGAAELANIVAGYAKGRLAQTSFHFQISPPRHYGGPWSGLGPAPCVIRLSSDFGDFLLQVELEPHG